MATAYSSVGRTPLNQMSPPAIHNSLTGTLHWQVPRTARSISCSRRRSTGAPGLPQPTCTSLDPGWHRRSSAQWRLYVPVCRAYSSHSSSSQVYSDSLPGPSGEIPGLHKAKTFATHQGQQQKIKTEQHRLAEMKKARPQARPATTLPAVR